MSQNAIKGEKKPKYQKLVQAKKQLEWAKMAKVNKNI